MPDAKQCHASGDRVSFRHAMEKLQLKLVQVKSMDLPNVSLEDFQIFSSCINVLAKDTTVLIDGSGGSGFLGISMLMKKYVDDFGQDLDKEIEVKQAQLEKVVMGHPTIEGIPWYEDSAESYVPGSSNLKLSMNELEQKFKDNLMNANAGDIEAQADVLQEASRVLLMLSLVVCLLCVVVRACFDGPHLPRPWKSVRDSGSASRSTRRSMMPTSRLPPLWRMPRKASPLLGL